MHKVSPSILLLVTSFVKSPHEKLKTACRALLFFWSSIFTYSSINNNIKTGIDLQHITTCCIHLSYIWSVFYPVFIVFCWVLWTLVFMIFFPLVRFLRFVNEPCIYQIRLRWLLEMKWKAHGNFTILFPIPRKCLAMDRTYTNNPQNHIFKMYKYPSFFILVFIEFYILIPWRAFSIV